MTPPRLAPLLEQFDWACLRLLNRMAGPVVDSGNGTPVEVPPMTTEEYLWEPVPDSWSVRSRKDGPGPRATLLTGAGEWGRDSAQPGHPYPPPFTTIAWRLSHICEMLTLRADYTTGRHVLASDTYVTSGEAADAIAAFVSASDAWRGTLLSCDDAALETVGLSTYPYGSDAQEVFLDIVWWVNQEVLHHGAEIALLRDLYRARQSHGWAAADGRLTREARAAAGRGKPVGPGGRLRIASAAGPRRQGTRRAAQVD